MLKTLSNITFTEVDAIKKRFLMINRERLRRAEDCMRGNQRDFLDFLPLLFHTNHPRLPGYFSKDAPSGICDYVPSSRALTAANKYVNRFEYQKRAMRRYDIISMFLMGSSGTVAYSKKSDFDIWLCHQSDLGADRLADLQTKATAIEQWADEQGLEVHFFLMEPESFKAGKIVDLSSESSGTAQYYLLLEEFYRTSLLMAGRYPAWWLVPVEQEANYDEYVAALREKRLISEAEVVDFGGIPTVPAEEFFGAALWQLFKGIDSPYKSVLKLLLMEVYAHEYPNIELLCLRFKKAIFSGENDLDRLDPYLMLYKKLEEYLVKREDEERLELVRRCFYLKVGQKLSLPEPKEFDWRRDVMRSQSNSWGWERNQLQTIDNRANWKIQQVVKERGILVKELTYTYQFLSDFARKYAQLAAINQRDMTALGRKLYAAFERKTGKVEIVNRGISENVWEPVLTFYQIRQRDQQGGWTVLVDAPGEVGDANGSTAVKRTQSLIEALSWAHFNGLMDVVTVPKAIRADGRQVTREIEDFERAIVKLMPRSLVLETNVEALGRAVKVQQAVVVVNLGADVGAQNARDGKCLASNRMDAFSYGGMFENLISSFDMIVLTSWKEVVTSHHSGIENVLNGISSYFQWSQPSKGVAPPMPEVLCVSQNHSTTIRQRVERLFKEVIDCFYGSKEGINNRFVFMVERIYFVLYLEDDALRFQRLPSYSDLLRYLGKGRQTFGRIVVDDAALNDTLLPLMLKFNKPGVVQLFYKDEGKVADVYVLDEYGSLFYQQVEFFDSQRLLLHFRKFFDSVLHRQHFQLSGVDAAFSEAAEVEFFRISRNAQHQLQVGRIEPTEGMAKGFFNIQVLAENNEAAPNSFRIYCDDREFSSLEHGGRLFAEVAAYIVSMRQGGQRYPIFITDLDLPPSMFADYGGGRAPVVDFLNHKKNIETKLNEALGALSRGAVRALRPDD